MSSMWAHSLSTYVKKLVEGANYLEFPYLSPELLGFPLATPILFLLVSFSPPSPLSLSLKQETFFQNPLLKVQNKQNILVMISRANDFYFSTVYLPAIRNCEIMVDCNAVKYHHSCFALMNWSTII